jgi:hypothetical protein
VTNDSLDREDFIVLLCSSLLRVTFYALEHRYVAEIYRVFERLISLVAGLAFAISQPAEVDQDPVGSAPVPR